MQIQTLIITATLAAPATVSEQSNYHEMLDEVVALTEAINAGEAVREQLFNALAKFPQHAPLLATDPDGRAIRARAQLNLARTYLAEGATESAAGVMDEILRSSHGEALPIDEFGPSLARLHEERRTALARAGTASLEIRCRVPCRVYVNERAAAGQVRGLYLGIYRIWIEAVNADADDVHSELVKLSERNETVTVDFPSSMWVEKAAPSAPERVLPRAAEIGLLVAGCLTASAGGLLLGLNGDDIRAQTIAGATLTGIGGTALLVGGITLSVDEVRLAERHGRQAMLVWQMQF